MNRYNFNIKKKIEILLGVCVAGLLAGIVFLKYITPTVSVVMPSYNREDLLPRVIDSILNQTMTDFEFIIVDDASTDKSIQILKDYQKKDKRIKIIQLEKNQGVAGARQVGTDAARGKYIAIMDSDDLALPLFLETAVKFLEQNKETTILKLQPGYHNHTEDPIKDMYTIPSSIHHTLFKSSIGNVGVIFRRSFVEQHNIRYNPEFICAEDFDYWTKMIMKGANVRYLPTHEKALYSIRRHPFRDYGACWKYAAIVEKNISDFFNIPKEKKKDYCFLFQKAIEFNPQMFDTKTILTAKREFCPPTKKHIYVKHPKWTDYFVFSKNKSNIYRYSVPTEKAKIISFIPNKKITIKWDRWGQETFIYLSDNTYSLEPNH